MTDTNDFSQPASPSSDVSSAFELLARGVQRQLWRMGWTELRPIQVHAIRAITQSDADVVIAAETASGKTEAAFLPIISRISDEPPSSVRALYVGPLRALINDQFQRIEDLCQYVDVPTHRWHGDVGAAAKSSLLKNPAGVLLITPESIESLFVNRSSHLPRLFGGLRYVVIDELHSFLDSERGIHLQSLLCRLRRVVGASDGSFRTVGLSATLGEMIAAQRYVNRDKPKTVAVIRDDAGGKELRYRLHAYVSEPSTELAVAEDAREDSGELDVMRQIAEDLVEHCRGSSNLVFANAKGDIEVYADLCNEITRRDALPESFLVHHGSLSREIREDTEAGMKDGHRQTAICSSTLEMGIDIGSVRTVGQIGATWSVSSLKQRLGRSGRKDDDPRIMRVYIACRDPGSDGSLLDRLHLELIQAIAATELLLSGWVEPPTPATCDLSTLTQQIISVIAETGGTTASELHARLIRLGAFRDIELSLFKALLQCLGRADIAEQIATGELILGLEGERIRAGRDFYAAFQTPAEFTVTTGQRLIGTVPILGSPSVDDHILLGGRRWKVVSVDYDRSEILVEPARGKKRPLFMGGVGAVHGRIRETMRDVLHSGDRYVYLNSTASDLLARARRTAEEAGMLTDPVVAIDDRKSLWFNWAGTNTQSTMAALLGAIGVDVIDRGVGLEVALPKSEVGTALAKVLSAKPDPESVAEHVLPKLRRKYDEFLSDKLLDTAIIRDVLNLDEAVRLCRNLANPIEHRSEKSATNISTRPTGVRAPRIISGRPMKALRSYLVFDFETTGLDCHRDRIIQVGLCRVAEGKVVDRTGWLVRQDVPIRPEAQRKHGITVEALRKHGTTPEASLTRLLAAMREAPACMGHNIHMFDLRFLRAECRRAGVREPNSSAFIDTAALFKGWRLGAPYDHRHESPRDHAIRVLSTRVKDLKYSIAACLEALGVEADKSGMHDASEDAYLTYLIFEALQGRL
ncbi:MAG: DEAD/DEAH box helicase [Phycisphaerae bacterium]|nr:DEAD/DEAH box helicase [Phycisphaerae bacterium]